jgi:hypothetical protein
MPVNTSTSLYADAWPGGLIHWTFSCLDPRKPPIISELFRSFLASLLGPGVTDGLHASNIERFPQSGHYRAVASLDVLKALKENKRAPSERLFATGAIASLKKNLGERAQKQ